MMLVRRFTLSSCVRSLRQSDRTGWDRIPEWVCTLCKDCALFPWCFQRLEKSTAARDGDDDRRHEAVGAVRRRGVRNCVTRATQGMIGANGLDAVLWWTKV
jgi:hypothetical protein